MPTRREVLLAASLSIAGLSASTLFAKDQSKSIKGCSTCTPVTTSSLNSLEEGETALCEYLIVDAEDTLELSPEQGQVLPNEGWDALFGTVEIGQSGNLFYTAPAFRPAFGLDVVTHVDDFGGATFLKLKIVNGALPESLLEDEQGNPMPIDPQAPEWIDEPCVEVVPLISVAETIQPVLRLEGALQEEIVEVFQLPDTGAITLCLVQRQTSAQPPKPRPQKCHKQCRNNLPPDNCNGRTVWSVGQLPPGYSVTKSGGHDWKPFKKTMKVTANNKYIIRQYLGTNWEVGMDVLLEYDMKLEKKKWVSLSDIYQCVGGKPKWINTQVCVRTGESKEFLPAWIATLFGVTNNGMTWNPSLDENPDCYFLH